MPKNVLFLMAKKVCGCLGRNVENLSRGFYEIRDRLRIIPCLGNRWRKQKSDALNVCWLGLFWSWRHQNHRPAARTWLWGADLEMRIDPSKTYKLTAMWRKFRIILCRLVRTRWLRWPFSLCPRVPPGPSAECRPSLNVCPSISFNPTFLYSYT